MAKEKKVTTVEQTQCFTSVENGRGVIKDNYLKALVTSQLFRHKVEKNIKGKGSYQRKAKNGGLEPYLISI